MAMLHGMSCLWVCIWLWLGAVASGDLSMSLRRSPQPQAWLADANVTSAKKGPYRPHAIDDPFTDVNCGQEACEGPSTACSQFPFRLCSEYPNCPNNKVCLHKQLFPMLPDDLLLFGVTFVVAVFAGAAGIGGGGLNVPIIMMVSFFGIKEAVPLSHVAVLGNSIAQLLFNCRLRHPHAPERPLIHYELAVFALPAMLGGNNAGLVVGRLFPPSLLIVLSLVLLAIATLKTLVKAVELLKEFRLQKPTAEPSDMARQIPRSALLPPPRSPTVAIDDASADGGQVVRTWSGTNLVTRSPSGPQVSSAMLPNEIMPQPALQDPQIAMRIPWQVLWCMISFTCVFCLDFLLMSPDFFTHVQQCSWQYWLALLGLYPFVIAAIFVGVGSLRKLQAYHRLRGDAPVPGDPEVTVRLIILFPLAAFTIGVVAGLVGLGGGEFMVPLLLEFGLLPRVASATSGFLILFATFSNIVHYFVAGIMEPFSQYGSGLCVVAFLGAAVGLNIREMSYMRKHSYVLVFVLALLLAVSGGLLAYRGFVIAAWDWGFKPLCSA